MIKSLYLFMATLLVGCIAIFSCERTGIKTETTRKPHKKVSIFLSQAKKHVPLRLMKVDSIKANQLL